MGSIIVPIFYGEDPELWIEWIDTFVSAHSFSDFETVQFAYGFIEGEALEWYCDEIARSVFNSWEDLKRRLLQRFCKSVEGVEKLSLQERLKQLSRDMERWDEEEEAIKLHEESWVADDELQKGSVGRESLEGIIPTTWAHQKVLKEKDEPHTKMSEIPNTLFKGGNVGFENCRADQYFERGKGLTVELFEFSDTNMKKEYQQRKTKLSVSNMGECAYQLFDHMPKRRTKVAKKKKRWKGTTKKKNKLQRWVTRAKRTFLAKRWMWKFTRKRKKRMKLEKLEKKRVKSNKGGSHYLSMRQMMKEYEVKRYKHKLEQKKLIQGRKRTQKKLEKWRKHKFKQKNHKDFDVVVMKIRKLLAAKMIREASRQNLHMSQVLNKKWLLRFIEKKKGRMKSATWKRKKLNNKRKKKNDKNKKRFSGNYVAVSWDSKLEPLLELRRKRFSGWFMRKLYNIVYLEFRKWMQINDFVKLNWGQLLVADEKKREAVRVKRRKSKHKPEKWNHLHSQLHKRLHLKSQGMRRMKGCKRVKWGCIVLDMMLLWEIQVENKPQIGHEAECYQEKRKPLENLCWVLIRIYETQEQIRSVVMQRREKLGSKGINGKLMKNNSIHMSTSAKWVLKLCFLIVLSLRQWKATCNEKGMDHWQQRTMTNNSQLLWAMVQKFHDVRLGGQGNMLTTELAMGELSTRKIMVTAQWRYISGCLVVPGFVVATSSGHFTTKEMFHFLRPPEFSIFKERNEQELEQDNKLQDPFGSTLFIPVSLVIDKGSAWKSRRDDMIQVLMAFGLNERDTNSGIQVAVVDCVWDPGGTSLGKVHEAVLIMAGCLMVMEQGVYLKLSVTGMKRSSEAVHKEEFEIGKRYVMRMKLPMVGEKTLQFTVDYLYSHVAIVSVELLFHFTRPPEVHLVSVEVLFHFTRPPEVHLVSVVVLFHFTRPLEIHQLMWDEVWIREGKCYDQVKTRRSSGWLNYNLHPSPTLRTRLN